MPYYVVNKNAQSGSRDYEVHDLASTQNCLPHVSARIDLGFHPTCSSAVAAAQIRFRTADGCYYCANACHTG